MEAIENSILSILEERIDFWSENPHVTDAESKKMIRELLQIRSMFEDEKVKKFPNRT